MDVTNYKSDGSGASIIATPSGKTKKIVVGQIAANPDALLGIKAAAKALGDTELVELWKTARAEAETVSKIATKTSPKPKAKVVRKSRSQAPPLPMSPSSPRALPVSSGSPRGGANLPQVRVPAPVISSPRGSPRTSPRM